MTFNCWRMGRRESHSLDQVLFGALGTASWMPVLVNKIWRVGTNSGLGGQRRGRRGHVCTEGQRHLGFPPKMYATGQEAQMRKARAKLDT